MNRRNVGSRFLYYVNRLYSLVLTEFGNVRLPGWWSLQIVLFISLCLLSLKAYSQCNVSGDIPFSLENDTQDSFLCIFCQGPWGRTSGIIQLNDAIGLQDCKFYAVNNDIFSPFGLWSCGVGSEFEPSACEGDTFPFQDFCLKSSDTEVKLRWFIFTEDEEELSIDKPPPPCSSSASSFLGDNSRQEKSKRDSDTFLFNGMAGDEVRLTLVADHQDGNNGGEASLGISGNSLDDETSGALPLEITATLPADGEYSVIVEQPKNPAGQRFRGSYILSVETSTGVDLIEPTNSVER